MKRFALYEGVKPHLVGYPVKSAGGALHVGAKYACQRKRQLADGEMAGYSHPDYEGPEQHELFEPIKEVLPVEASLEKAVKAGHLKRGKIHEFKSLRAAMKVLQPELFRTPAKPPARAE
jgi:hypothetical protein